MTFPHEVPVLSDGVVTLRAHRAADAGPVLEQSTDPESQRWTTVPVAYTEADAVAFVTDHVPSGWSAGRWAFAVDGPDHDGAPRFAGTVELRDEGRHRAEIAYGAHPWVRGQGMTTRALALLLDWGFETLGLETVAWWANAGNWASRRTAWKLGFRLGGRVHRWVAHRDRLLDGWVATLHRDDPRTPVGTWLETPRIAGRGLELRPLSELDVPRIVEAASDERSPYWLARMPRPSTEQDALDWVEDCHERQATGRAVTWAVADPTTSVLLGAVNVFDLTAGRSAEIGWWTHPAVRGRGVATRACGLAVGHALAPAAEGGLGLLRVTANAAVGNAASRHVIETSGFTLVGRERRALLLGDGSLVDRVRYDRLREDPAPPEQG